VTDTSHDLATQRVEHAMRRFQDTWANRGGNVKAVSEDLDELDIAVGLWLDVAEEPASKAVRTG